MDRKKVEKSPKMRWRKWRKVPRAHLSIQRMEKSQWRKVEKSGEKWRKVEKCQVRVPLQNYESPNFWALSGILQKNSMLCTISLFSRTKYDKVEISIGRKWRKVKNEVEKSGEKSNAYA